jgi:hypothetical protein
VTVTRQALALTGVSGDRMLSTLARPTATPYGANNEDSFQRAFCSCFYSFFLSRRGSNNWFDHVFCGCLAGGEVCRVLCDRMNKMIEAFKKWIGHFATGVFALIFFGVAGFFVLIGAGYMHLLHLQHERQQHVVEKPRHHGHSRPHLSNRK